MIFRILFYIFSLFSLFVLSFPELFVNYYMTSSMETYDRQVELFEEFSAKKEKGNKENLQSLLDSFTQLPENKDCLFCLEVLAYVRGEEKVESLASTKNITEQVKRGLSSFIENKIQNSKKFLYPEGELIFLKKNLSSSSESIVLGFSNASFWIEKSRKENFLRFSALLFLALLILIFFFSWLFKRFSKKPSLVKEVNSRVLTSQEDEVQEALGRSSGVEESLSQEQKDVFPKVDVNFLIDKKKLVGIGYKAIDLGVLKKWGDKEEHMQVGALDEIEKNIEHLQKVVSNHTFSEELRRFSKEKLSVLDWEHILIALREIIYYSSPCVLEYYEKESSGSNILEKKIVLDSEEISIYKSYEDESKSMRVTLADKIILGQTEEGKRLNKKTFYYDYKNGLLLLPVLRGETILGAVRIKKEEPIWRNQVSLTHLFLKDILNF